MSPPIAALNTAIMTRRRRKLPNGAGDNRMGRQAAARPRVCAPGRAEQPLVMTDVLDGAFEIIPAAPALDGSGNLRPR